MRCFSGIFHCFPGLPTSNLRFNCLTLGLPTGSLWSQCDLSFFFPVESFLDPKALACAYVQGGHWPVAFELLAMMQDNGEESETEKPEKPSLGVVEVVVSLGDETYLPAFLWVFIDVYLFHISAMKRRDPVIPHYPTSISWNVTYTFHPFPGQITLCWPQCRDLRRLVARFFWAWFIFWWSQIPDSTIRRIFQDSLLHAKKKFCWEPQIQCQLSFHFFEGGHRLSEGRFSHEFTHFSPRRIYWGIGCKLEGTDGKDRCPAVFDDLCVSHCPRCGGRYFMFHTLLQSKFLFR